MILRDQKAANVRMAFESVSRFPDFQAEYEGSIPFTRSTIFDAILRFGAIVFARSMAALGVSSATSNGDPFRGEPLQNAR
ncbi:hypothetical protein AB7Z32_17135 [Bradyrhizobium sp. 482_C4_N1_1]|uniref:hypothetical protein n=1 Tax=unclassified Bradyrhizobium TaxID=2631580 RepID=UPI003392D364